jgi:hypothetical protein
MTEKRVCTIVKDHDSIVVFLPKIDYIGGKEESKENQGNET